MADLARTPAARLARRAHSLEWEHVTEHLAFRVADEVFALPLADVRELLSPPSTTFVPRAPRAVLGISSVRGMLVTVLDLGVCFGKRARPVAPASVRRARVLLVRAPHDETIGLLVDEVLNVVRLAEQEIEPATALGGTVSEHVVGLGRQGDQLLILLSLAAVLKVL